MAMSESFRNTYEEAPERLRDQLKDGKNETGEKPSSKPSRATLLEEHKAHLQWLSVGDIPIKNMILLRPYPPSWTKLPDEQCQQIHIDDLRINTRNPETAVFLRTITSPYIHSNCITIVEDLCGNVTRLTVCNLEDSMMDPILLEGSIIAVKQPCWSRLVDGGYTIRVDHPSDMVVLDEESGDVPSAWKRAAGEKGEQRNWKEWRRKGDDMFLAKKFRRAVVCYNRALSHLPDPSNPAAEIDLRRKLCGVHIILLRLDAAAHDLSLAISTHARSTTPLSSHTMSSPQVVKAWLHNHSRADPHAIASNLPTSLKDLATRIKLDLGIFTDVPEYDFAAMVKARSPLTLHVDAPSYISATEVKDTLSHGRGLFAKKAFATGELICAEKAFVLPGYFMNHRGSDCLLYGLEDGTAVARPGALLFRELVQAGRWNGSLRGRFEGLGDGGYWERCGWGDGEGNEEGEGVVDIFRTEYIRRYNSFSVPPTSLSPLAPTPPVLNPELRNGFWIHASYFNHSCLPNAIRTFIGDIYFMRAARPIAAGEEITQQYITPDLDIQERQSIYNQTWGFECDCKLCTVECSISENVRKERARLFDKLKRSVEKLSSRLQTVTGIKKIARGLRELEKLYLSTVDGDQRDSYEDLPRLALVHPTLFLTEAWRGVGNVEKTVEYGIKLLRNFGIVAVVEGGRFLVVSCAGFINIEGVRALKYLAEAYTVKGEERLAEDCKSLSRTWYLIITGSEVGMSSFLSLP